MSTPGASAEGSILMGSEATLVQRLQDFRIDYYCRFKDAIFIIYNSSELLHEFMCLLRRGHPFDIQYESIDSTQAKSFGK